MFREHVQDIGALGAADTEFTTPPQERSSGSAYNPIVLFDSARYTLFLGYVSRRDQRTNRALVKSFSFPQCEPPTAADL